MSAIFNRMMVDPFGIHGGKPGKNSGIYVRKAGTKDWKTFSELFGTTSPSKFANINLKRGDQVKIIAPGGGGWGDPMNRSSERVRADLQEGFITQESAINDYGLAAQCDEQGIWKVAPR